MTLFMLLYCINFPNPEILNGDCLVVGGSADHDLVRNMAYEWCIGDAACVPKMYIQKIELAPEFEPVPSLMPIS